ncbi:hypothetical protein [Vibrio jasicida]|uniref:hypothetical protein n=1 Tax=Vibrio jasicida TaxID=766224 RepID=UPI0018CE37C5|nr:hypothetical protein [Vibrio jasicida]
MMKYIYIDADQISIHVMQKIIHQYINHTEKPTLSPVSLHFTYNTHSSKRRSLLNQYRMYGVIGVEVPIKKQAADMMIIASIQERLTINKLKHQQTSIALSTQDKTLFSVAQIVYQRYLCDIEFLTLDSLILYFQGKYSNIHQ